MDEMDNEDGVPLTLLLDRLQSGDTNAVDAIWDKCFEKLSSYARRRLKSMPASDRDGEDVALSAIDTFVRRVGKKEFSAVIDSEDLWRVLFDITAKRVAREQRRQLTKKRGGGDVKNEVDLIKSDNSSVGVGINGKIDIRQQFFQQLDEDRNELLESLASVPGGEMLVKVVELHLEGNTHKEISELLGVSISTIERNMKIAKEIGMTVGS